MVSGVRATVKFTALTSCPLAKFSADSDTIIDQVSTCVVLPGSSGSVTEFVADATQPSTQGEWTSLFPYGSATLYRITHDDDDDEAVCPCECLGQFGCPVHRYVAADGDLTLVFHTEDFEQLQDVMAAFRDRFPDIDVQRLLQPPLEGMPHEQVFINRGKLTDRQHEVLQTAFTMGYFERPKRANATEIATELGISQSTVTQHLVTAQRKILEDVFDETA